MSTEQPSTGRSSAGTTPAGTIEMRQTPNPNARKFVLGGMRFGASRNYTLGDVVDEPLAAQLLKLAGVYNVMLAQDFVTVNKAPQVEWPALQAAIQQVLADFISPNSTDHRG